MTNFQKNVLFVAAVGCGVWMIRRYGYIKECMGYMDGVNVTAKAYENCKIKETLKKDEETVNK